MWMMWMSIWFLFFCWVFFLQRHESWSGAPWPEDGSARAAWGSHHDITEAFKHNLRWCNERSGYSPPSASFSCATVRENFKSTPRHASSSPRTFNQKQTWSKRWWEGGARTHAQRSSASPPPQPPPQAPPATWNVSCYELTREESWLHCNRAKPHTSSLLLIVLNQIHAVPSHTHTEER